MRRWPKVVAAARRRDGFETLRALARARGYHLIRADFNSPITDTETLPESTWTEPAPMPGVDLRLDAGIELLEQRLAPYIAEYAPPDDEPGTANGYRRDNNMFGALDAEVLYAMVRAFAPRRIVEVGAGFSSLVIADATDRNAEDGRPTEHRIFEPYPSAALRSLGGKVPVETIRAEDIPARAFGELEEGDFLFIDTTHTLRPGNDVLRLLLEVLPTLAPGVIVHVHDFFRPYEYPRFLIDEFAIHWQEHYLLQAFLAFNDEWEVLLANHALVRAHRERVAGVVPRLPSGFPGSSLWMRPRGGLTPGRSPAS